MARTLSGKTRGAGQVDAIASAPDAYELDIEIDEDEGLLRIYDPRAFHTGRRGFCRRLIESIAGRPGFERAEIDLGAASCRLKFDPRSATARSMAETVTAAVQFAAASGHGADRRRWWARPSRWSTLTAFRTPDGISSWETLDARPGRIQLRHEGPQSAGPRLSDVSEALATLEGVEASRVSTWSGTITLEYRPESPVAHGLIDAIERTLQESHLGPSSHGEITPDRNEAVVGHIAVATGIHRLRYLALAGGSFAMTVLGLVVPGIPTVPFLLATSYYLARSSPRMNDRLRRTAVFGPILVEWEQYQGLGTTSKARLIGLTGVIVLVTVALSAASPVVVALVLVIALISIIGIARIPGLPDDAPGASGPAPSGARLALPLP
jgi:uncharacterized membrane protein YbaN (DUF454 family)